MEKEILGRPRETVERIIEEEKVNIYLRTKKYIYSLFNRVKSKVDILRSFLTEKTYEDYLVYKSKNKSLLFCFYEWFFNEPLKYMFIGFLIWASLALQGWHVNYLFCTVAYWLLFRLLWLIIKKE